MDFGRTDGIATEFSEAERPLMPGRYPLLIKWLEPVVSEQSLLSWNPTRYSLKSPSRACRMLMSSKWYMEGAAIPSTCAGDACQRSHCRPRRSRTNDRRGSSRTNCPRSDACYSKKMRGMEQDWRLALEQQTDLTISRGDVSELAGAVRRGAASRQCDIGVTNHDRRAETHREAQER